MSQLFAFPPPPPPPPRRDSQPPENGSTHKPLHRGGGRGSGRGRGTLRGGNVQRGVHARGRGRGFGTSSSSNNARYNQSPRHTNGLNVHSGQEGRHGMNVISDTAPKITTTKRTHDAAFGSKPTSLSRPKAPPAVPSFNVDIESLLSKKPQAHTEQKQMPVKKNNILGLTPSNHTVESESEEDDDEAKLAHMSTADGLTFNHNGQTLSLRTPEEIAAWISERKKKYPTNAKIEAAKKEAAEKKIRWEAQKKEREEASRIRREETIKRRHENEKQKIKQRMLAQVTARAKAAIAAEKDDGSRQALLKANKLRREVERATKQLKEAEDALRKAQAEQELMLQDVAVEPTEFPPRLKTKHTDSTRDNDKVKDEEDNMAEPVDTSEESDSDATSNVQNEDTSTSGSSDDDSASDSDAAPEEVSSRRSGPDPVLPPPRRAGSSVTAQLCRNYVKYGRCKYGKKCRYSHQVGEKEKSSKTRNAATSDKRRGLYQIMVEKEQLEQQKQALRAIIALGDKGLLGHDTEDQTQ